MEDRTGRAAPPEIQERRAAMAAALAKGLWRTDPAPAVETLNAVRILRFSPPGDSLATVVHLHGGGYRLGCPEMIGPFAAALAARCQVTVVCPAYRLAPEHPFPAGLNDVLSVAAALHGAGEQPLFLSGDSAGGGLAAAATAKLAQEGVALAGLILLSPWLDLTCTSRSYEDNGPTDPLFSLDSAKTAAELYLQGLDPSQPLASPLFASPADFPPTFISVGTGEVLLEDSQTFARRLSAAGVEASLLPIAGMDHVAVTRDLAAPGAAETFEALVDFLQRRLKS